MSERHDGPCLIGIDLGGTKVLAGVVDAESRLVGRAKRSTPAGQGEAEILNAVIECAMEAVMTAELQLEQLAGVGIGAPGTLDLDAGVIRLAPNLGVRDFALAEHLGAALRLPVLLRNDVRAGGYGEFRLGAGRGHDDLLAVFVGTGIGGCLIRNGELFVGPTQNAGEIGHILAKVNGPKCGCGNRGCLEAMASRTAITRRVGKAIGRGEQTVLRGAISGKTRRLKSGDLAAAFAQGDEVAVREVERAAKTLGLALGGLINLSPPGLILIGGGVTEALGDPYVERVRHWTQHQAMADPDHRVEIRRTALGDDAGVQGAALFAREKFVAPPTN